MKIAHVILVSLLVLNFSTDCLCVNLKSKENARNVLIFIGDDMGFEIGAYNNTVIDTPNIDSLAKRGVVLTGAHTAVSSCSPSRSAILTGLPSHQNGMYGLHHPPHNFNSIDTVWSMPRILKNNNIRTGIIGKKHVGPESVYPFDFSHTEETESLLQVGRNISRMRQLAREFLHSTDGPFLLYIGFYDPHRCGSGGQYGGFCERFGNGEPGMGVIDDWTPMTYAPEAVRVPYFIPDNPDSRRDISSQYTAINRMDQGIGLIMDELTSSGHVDDTLVLFTSDNGIPFPGAKTNLYTPGMGEPMIVSSPLHKETWGQEVRSLVSLLDVTPTVLDWFGLSYPEYRIIPQEPLAKLTGQSLLPLLQAHHEWPRDAVYGSHDYHEITGNYPMRTIKTRDFQLIHNINYKMPYPIAGDVASSLTYTTMMRNASQHRHVDWYRPLESYYYRDLWELYDLQADPRQIHNLVYAPRYIGVVMKLKLELFIWLGMTSDFWFCSPGGVLDISEYNAIFGNSSATGVRCLEMYNKIPMF